MNNLARDDDDSAYWAADLGDHGRGCEAVIGDSAG